MNRGDCAHRVAVACCHNVCHAAQQALRRSVLSSVSETEHGGRQTVYFIGTMSGLSRRRNVRCLRWSHRVRVVRFWRSGWIRWQRLRCGGATCRNPSPLSELPFLRFSPAASALLYAASAPWRTSTQQLGWLSSTQQLGWLSSTGLWSLQIWISIWRVIWFGITIWREKGRITVWRGKGGNKGERATEAGCSTQTVGGSYHPPSTTCNFPQPPGLLLGIKYPVQSTTIQDGHQLLPVATGCYRWPSAPLQPAQQFQAVPCTGPSG